MHFKRFLCMILVLCMCLTMVPVKTKAASFANSTLETPNYSSAVTSVAELNSRLNSLMTKYEGTSWTSTGSPCTSHDTGYTCYSKYYYGHQCSGFAKYIFNDLFCGGSIGSTSSGDYALYNLGNATMVGQKISIGDQDGASAKSLLSQAKPGDFIQAHRRGKSYGHSMIVVSVSDTGIKLFDCNSGSSRCTVRVYDQDWDTFASKNDSFSLYRSTKHPEDDSSTGAPVDVGTNFYALIINTSSEMLLTNDSSNVSIRSNAGTNNQIWYFERLGDGSYKITSAYDGNSLDVDNAGTEDGTNLKTYPYHGSDAQKWWITESSGSYVFSSKCADTVIDLCSGSTEEGTNVQMWTYNGTDAQLFTIRTVDYLGSVDVGTDFYAYILNTAYWMALTNDSNNVSLRSGTDTLDQVWYFERLSDGSYKITSALDGYSLDVDCAGTDDGTNLKTYPYSGHLAQQWWISGDGGSRVFQSKCSFDVIDVANNSSEEGTNIQMWTYNETSAQLFQIWPLDEFVINYDANGGTGAPPSQMKLSHVNVTLHDTIPERTNYIFVGWSTNASATTASYQPGDSYTVDESVTLYAVWKHVCAEGHSYTYKVTKAPTTSATGTLTGTCSKCSGTTTVTLPKLNTTDYTYKVTKAATCTENGTGRYTWKTTTYGSFYFDVTISKTGHNYEAVVTEPTCTEDGYTTHTCTVCGDSYADSHVDALGHEAGTAVVENKVEATCETEGHYDIVAYCSVCGEELSCETVTIPATGHSYGAWKTTKEPTCTETGTKQRSCTACGKVETEELTAKGHKYESAVTEPTCTEQGYTTYTCDLCGDSYVGDYTAPVDHSYVDGSCIWCGEEETYVQWIAATTSLNGTIDLNIYIGLSDNILNDPNAYVRFIHSGVTVDVPMSEAVEAEKRGDICYRFSCEIFAKQVADTVTIQVMDENGAISDALEYSVMKYCVNQINKNADPELVAVCKALLNYAAAAQTYFDYNTGNLANASLSDADKVLPEVDASAYKFTVVGSEPGIKPRSATLMLEAEVAIRVYFTLEEGCDISDYTFTIDGKEVAVQQNDKGYYIESDGIPAKELDDMHQFSVGGLTVNYGALSYVNSKAASDDVLEANLAKALYAYYAAAEALLG